MDTATLITRVKRQFGDETGAQIETADVIAWINQGQLEILRKTEGLYASTTINLVAGTPAYALPAEFFKVHSVSLAGKLLKLTTSGEANDLYPSRGIEAGGTPTRYWIRHPNIHFHPSPVAAAAVTLDYVQRPVLITLTTDPLTVNAAFHNTLLDYCLAQAHQLDGNMEVHTALMGAFRSGSSEDMHDARHIDETTYPSIRSTPGDY